MFREQCGMQANSLLASLAGESYRRLAPWLDAVSLAFGEVLYEPGAAIRHVYFPAKCVVSLLAVVDGRGAFAVGLVGREGMVGVPLALGVGVSPVRALVQGGGSAMRMSATRFRKALGATPALQHTLHRYAHALMAQITQTASSNHFHAVEARVARWLVMTRDRLGSSEFRLTHEFLAHMLGVRREGVTGAASCLQRRGLITYRRGELRIVDYVGLEAAACGCYEFAAQRASS